MSADTSDLLLIQLAAGVSWFFPLSQLIWFKWDQGNNDSGDHNNRQSKPAGVLMLRFVDVTVTVQSRYPEQILHKILSRHILTLVAAPGMQAKGPSEHYYPEDDPEAPDRDGQSVFTGPIQVKKDIDANQ
jgi:hypothetical protein